MSSNQQRNLTLGAVALITTGVLIYLLWPRKVNDTIVKEQIVFAESSSSDIVAPPKENLLVNNIEVESTSQISFSGTKVATISTTQISSVTEKVDVTFSSSNNATVASDSSSSDAVPTVQSANIEPSTVPSAPDRIQKVAAPIMSPPKISVREFLASAPPSLVGMSAPQTLPTTRAPINQFLVDKQLSSQGTSPSSSICLGTPGGDFFLLIFLNPTKYCSMIYVVIFLLIKSLCY